MSVSKRPKIDLIELHHKSEYLKDDNLNEMLKPLSTVENLKSPIDGQISKDDNNEKSFLFDNREASPAKSSPELILFNSSDSFLDFEDTLDTKTEPLDNFNCGSVDQNGIIKEKSNSINENIDPKIYDHVKNEQFSTDLETHKNYTYHDIPLPPEVLNTEDSKSSLPNCELLNPNGIVKNECNDTINGTIEPLSLHLNLNTQKENIFQEVLEKEINIQKNNDIVKCNEATPEETNSVFEKEKNDIVDPRWKSIKELTSNEQRYKEVKKCWGSSTVPDPDRNLTYHSYRRKKWLRSGEQKKVQQRKRKATTSLNNEIKKPCTYLVDKEIDKVKIENDEENRELQLEMKRTIDDLRQRHVQEEIYFNNKVAFKRRNCGNNFFSNSLQNTFNWNSRHELRMQINDVRNTYNKKAYDCDSKYISRLEALKGIREEVLQFYKFYKGLGSNAEKDPTILTDSQLKMLDDVESFYKQMENFYK